MKSLSAPLLCALSVILILSLAGCGAEVDHAQLAMVQRQAAANASSQALLKVPSDRKVIHTGELRIGVKKFETAEQEIKRLITAAEGQIADFREERTAGDRRAGHWKLRVPPAKFDELIEKVASLGEADLRSVQAADVTEEFVDIEARLKNKRQLEARILKLLDEKTGEIKDVVAVENELARIREEIERIEGRLWVLTNQIEFSTVSVYAYERDEYVPKAAATMGERIAATFFGSLRAMQEMGEQLLLFLVAVGPWLLLAALVGCGCWFLVRLIGWITRTCPR